MNWEARCKDLEKDNLRIGLENAKLRSKLSEINTLVKIAKRSLVTGLEEDENCITRWTIHTDNILDIIRYILEELEEEE